MTYAFNAANFCRHYYLKAVFGNINAITPFILQSFHYRQDRTGGALILYCNQRKSGKLYVFQRILYDKLVNFPQYTRFYLELIYISA